MTEKRKQEIIEDLLGIYESFKPYYENPREGLEVLIEEPSMFWLISTYTKTGRNKERVGGSWVRENIPELADLP